MRYSQYKFFWFRIDTNNWAERVFALECEINGFVYDREEINGEVRLKRYDEKIKRSVEIVFKQSNEEETRRAADEIINTLSNLYIDGILNGD